MLIKSAILVFTFFTVNAKVNNVTVKQVKIKNDYEEFNEHTVVTDSEVFPYVVALLKKSSYLSAGALIDENWIITDADSLYFTREAIKIIRVRLGSINYKKGGEVLPIKLFHIHPYFDDRKPLFDIALVMLARPLRFTPKIYPIRLRRTPKDVVASHFIVTSWSGSLELRKKPQKQVNSMEIIKRRRMLTVTHLHPSDPKICKEELKEIEINSTNATMCLDPGVKTNPCLKLQVFKELEERAYFSLVEIQRDVGAPVVLNGVLWGIISSWKPDHCNENTAGPSLVTLVSQNQVSTWLHATIHGHAWEYQDNFMDYNDLEY